MQELKLEELKKRGGGVGPCGSDKGNGGSNDSGCKGSSNGAKTS